MLSEASWASVVSDGLAYATSWMGAFKPVVASFVGLGVLGLAVLILRRAAS